MPALSWHKVSLGMCPYVELALEPLRQALNEQVPPVLLHHLWRH